MNDYLSGKLKALSFLLIILVVFLHSYNATIRFENSELEVNEGLYNILQEFISQGIARIAVPLFFIISGFLFYRNVDGTFQGFVIKMKSRFRTLVVPYLLWAIFGVLLYLFLQTFPLTKMFFVQKLIRAYSVKELLEVIFIHPIPYQLWFVRDLVVLVICSPLIYGLIKHLKYVALLLFFMGWAINTFYPIYLNQPLFFLGIGAFLGIYKKELLNVNTSKYAYLFINLWLILCLMKALCVSQGITGILPAGLTKGSILVGIIGAWSLYDKLFWDKKITESLLYKYFSFSFFIYAFHQPFMLIVKKMLFFIIGKFAIAPLVIYFSAPIVTISFALLVGKYISKLSPRFYSVITGGR